METIKKININIFTIGIIGVLFLFPNISNAEILFQENFDNISDWQPRAGINDMTPSGASDNCVNLSCSNAPGNWDLYRTTGVWWGPMYEDTLRINSEHYRGSSGKSFTVYNESHNGASGDGWGADGILAKYLDMKHSELWVEFWVQFDADFQFTSISNTMIKLFRFQGWNPDEGDFSHYFSSGANEPAYIFDPYYSNTYGWRHNHAFRCAPKETDYYCPDGFSGYNYRWPGDPYPEFKDVGQLGDGEWHKLKFHIKVNTYSEGSWSEDGVLQMWLDDNFVYERENLQLGFDGTDEDDFGFNVVGWGGNAYNKWTDESNFGEQRYSIDDIIVATTEEDLTNTNNIIFEDNFDNSPDWQSQQTVHKSVYPDGYDISWGITRSDTCTTHCPPQGWTSYRAASSYWTDARYRDTYLLNSEGARGGAGKGITYNVEVPGEYGYWAGGSLNLWLGEVGYDDLFVRFYLKYDAEWKWTNAEQSEHCQQKLIRISTFNDDIWNSSYNPYIYGSASVNWPVFIPDWYYNKSFDNTSLTGAVRQAPDYSAYTDGFTSVRWPEDGNWHSYEFHVKMNSGVGVDDGLYQIFIDGELKVDKNNVIWKKVGSDLDHNWNWLMLLDNVTNGSALKTDHVEMAIYMDDVVVSTSYIGPDDLNNACQNNSCEEVIRADVNQDGEINTIDAILTLRKTLGLDMSLSNWQVSDTTGNVNCDGSTNVIDAVLLLRYSLGLDMEGVGWCG